MAVEASADLDSSGRPTRWTLEIWSAPHGQRPGMGGLPNLEGAMHCRTPHQGRG